MLKQLVFAIVLFEIADTGCTSSSTAPTEKPEIIPVIAPSQTPVPPNPTQTLPPTEFIQFYLIIPGDNGQSGPPVGCGDSIVAVWRDRTKTGSLQGDIQASLEELLSIETADYGKSGYYHSLYDANLAVQSVWIDGNAAEVNLTGTLQLIGVCADAQMEAQILLTIFQYPGVNRALITINDRNMKQLFDASGTVRDDEQYRREGG